MTLDIPTLTHNLVQMRQDRDSIVTSIDTITKQLAAAQVELTRLAGARDYVVLAIQRAEGQLTTLQAGIPVDAPTS